MTPTDTQLKSALAKMLPDIIEGQLMPQVTNESNFVLFRKDSNKQLSFKDTELLHLCWLVEKELSTAEFEVSEHPNIEFNCLDDIQYMKNLVSATWQQRTIALCKVKDITL